MLVRFSPLTLGTTLVTVLSVLTAAPVADAGPIIQELYYDAAGGPDSAGVFTELFGTPGMPLIGWSLVGVNGSTGLPYRTIDLTGAVLPADGLLLIASTSAAVTLAALRDFTANVDWQNGPDAVRLLDPTSTVIDAVQYGNAGPNNNGLGLWAPDPPAGSSLSRDIFGTNTFDNFSDFSIGAPSPGQGPRLAGPVPPLPPGPPNPVPEPSTLALGSVGLALLLGQYVARRRRQ